MPPSSRQRITLFFLSILAGSSSGEAAEIHFKPQADVRGSLVLLGDIASIQDPDSQQVDVLKRIELFPAPARGRIRTVRDVEIRQLLHLHGISTAEHRFSGSELVCIAHGKAMPPASASKLANATTNEAHLVVVAKQPIATGTVIRALDVELKSPERPLTNGSAAGSADAVIGQESSRSYAAGQAIDTRSLRKPILVRRSDAVVVIAKAAGVRVRTTAKALADGGIGDLVPVESENRKNYTVVVTGPRQAEVFASGSIVTNVNDAPMSPPGGSQQSSGISLARPQGDRQ